MPKSYGNKDLMRDMSAVRSHSDNTGGGGSVCRSSSIIRVSRDAPNKLSDSSTALFH